jgi:hypothetical protein
MKPGKRETHILSEICMPFPGAHIRRGWWLGRGVEHPPVEIHTKSVSIFFESVSTAGPIFCYKSYLIHSSQMFVVENKKVGPRSPPIP